MNITVCNSGCGKTRTDSSDDWSDQRCEEKANRQNAAHDQTQEEERSQDTGTYCTSHPCILASFYYSHSVAGIVAESDRALLHVPGAQPGLSA